MPLRLVPALVLSEVQFFDSKMRDYFVSTAAEEDGKFRVYVSDIAYNVDPAKADSVGKPNIINATRTYALDGSLSTTGTTVSTNSTLFVNGDAGVDMETSGRYLVLAKVGLRTQSANSCVVGLFGSADLVSWYQIAGVSRSGTTEGFAYLAVRTNEYRAFKLMFYSTSSSANAYMRTYELSVFKVVV